MIRILVADDHPVVRTGLKEILSDDADILVAGEASCGQEVLDQARADDFNVVLLDISMPNTNVLDVIKHLRKEKPGLAILILSVHPEEQYALRLFRAGVSGYLQKESTPDELLTAVRRVAAGRKYITTSFAENLVSNLGAFARKMPHDSLSNREFAVMRSLASGKRPGEIAAEMSLSPKTISTYRNRILRKMNVKSDTELIDYARENQLVP